MTGMYSLFKTDAQLEGQGIYVDYGQFRVKIARAGGTNKRFAQVLDAKTKPYKRAIQTETLDNDRGVEILKEVYVEAVILDWEVKNGEGQWIQGIESPEGDILPFTKENVLAALRDLPDLFEDLKDQAGKAALFRQSIREADAGN